MHFACHGGLKDLVELMLESGANLESTTLNGATPLMRAVESSKPEVVQYLIEKGAKVQVENRKGELSNKILTVKPVLKGHPLGRPPTLQIHFLLTTFVYNLAVLGGHFHKTVNFHFESG